MILVHEWPNTALEPTPLEISAKGVASGNPAFLAIGRTLHVRYGTFAEICVGVGWLAATSRLAALSVAWITKSAKDVGHVLRDFRNFIHPHKEYADGIVISEDDASMFWELTKAISRQVLGSVGKSP